MNWDFNKEVKAKEILENYNEENKENKKKGILILIIILLLIIIPTALILIIEINKHEVDPNASVAINDEDIDDFLHNVIKCVGGDQCSTDGKISIWFRDVNPSHLLEPFDSWSTPEEKAHHVNDIYYNAKDGLIYIYKYENDEFLWKEHDDRELAIVLDIAHNMDDTKDGERKIFTCEVSTPYEPGDIIYTSDDKVQVIITKKDEDEEVSPDDYIPLEDYITSTTKKTTTKTTKKKTTTKRSTTSTSKPTTTTIPTTITTVPTTIYRPVTQVTTTVPTTTKAPQPIEIVTNLDIVFDNVQDTTKKAILKDNKSLYFNVQLEKPGDVYMFTFDIYNKGKIDAQLNSYKGMVMTVEQSKYIEMDMYYSTGESFKSGDVLKAGERKKIAFVARFKDQQEETYNGVTVNYSGQFYFVQMS